MAEPSIERFREFLAYCPQTGVITWRKSFGRKIRAGVIAGSLTARGYVRVRLDGKRYSGHRLGWFLFYGEWPSGQIDHKDGNQSNNRIDNLRDASGSVNAQNQRSAHANNKLGVLGVRRNHSRFQAAIKLNGRAIHVGTFDTAEAAQAAYLAAKRRLHQGCTI